MCLRSIGNAPLPSRGGPRRWVLAQHMARRNLGIRPPRLVHTQRQSTVGRGDACFLQRTPGQLRHLNLTGANSHPHGDGGKYGEGRQERARDDEARAGIHRQPPFSADFIRSARMSSPEVASRKVSSASLA